MQFDDCPPDPKPDELPVVLATLEHLIGTPSRDYFGVDPMFADQQIDGSPDVAIGDHSAFRSAASLTSTTGFGRRRSSARRNLPYPVNSTAV